jgi:hypothetical protein
MSKFTGVAYSLSLRERVRVRGHSKDKIIIFPSLAGPLPIGEGDIFYCQVNNLKSIRIF